MNEKELVKEFKKAFKDVPFPDNKPGDIAIASWHFTGEHMEGFIGKKWTEIDADFLKDGRETSLAVMTHKAIRYYIPAFILACLEDEKVFFGASILYTLNPWQEDYGSAMESRIMELFECFNPLTLRQKKAIRNFLLYINETGDDHCKKHSSSALKHYWQDFKMK